MLPGDRKDRGPSHKKTHSGGSSPRSRSYHKASDSGVGSLSDQDSLAANPDRVYAAAHDYMSSSSSPVVLLQRQFDNAQTQLKQTYSEIDRLKADLYDRDQTLLKLKKHSEILEADNTTLTNENRRLGNVLAELENANQDLEETMRHRSSPPRDRDGDHHHHHHYQMSGGLGGLGEEQPKSRQRESVRERHREEKEKEKEQKERERLMSRFESKEPKRAPSRSRRNSYVEPFGPGPSSTRPAVVVQTAAGSGSAHPPNSSRSYSTYSGSSARGHNVSIPAHSSGNIPRSPQTPGYAPGYPASPHPDGFEGDYTQKPLPREHNYRR